MKTRWTLLQSVSILATAGGLLIAFYAWQCQASASASARRQAEVDARVNYGAAGYVVLGNSEWDYHGAANSVDGGGITFVTYSLAERALGMVFGFGVCYLGAFGLYAEKKLRANPLP